MNHHDEPYAGPERRRTQRLGPVNACSGKAHGLLPPVAVRDVRRSGDWREDLRFALAETGNTHLSFATALGIPREHVTRLFNPSLRRTMSAEFLERMRDTPATRDVWFWFQWAQCEKAGAALIVDRRGA